MYLLKKYQDKYLYCKLTISGFSSATVDVVIFCGYVKNIYLKWKESYFRSPEHSFLLINVK